MSKPLQTQHPILMVPHVLSFSVVLCTNGVQPLLSAETIRSAIIAACPPGTGVGPITCNSHGVYEGDQGAKRNPQ